MEKYHMTVTESQRYNRGHRNSHVMVISQVTVTAYDKEAS